MISAVLKITKITHSQLIQMNVQEGYNIWAVQYDTNKNLTRDMEGEVMRDLITGSSCLEQSSEPSLCLEIGCGTGKNTVWLVDNFDHTICADFSKEMMSVAKQKVKNKEDKVTFSHTDITMPWTFVEDNSVNLATFSLILDHIENLEFVFTQLVLKVKSGGSVYFGILHPFKQYTGTKARFARDDQIQEVSSFIHNLSDFVRLGHLYGFEISKLEEYFDNNDRSAIPRIMGLLMQKKV